MELTQYGLWPFFFLAREKKSARAQPAGPSSAGQQCPEGGAAHASEGQPSALGRFFGHVSEGQPSAASLASGCYSALGRVSGPRGSRLC